MIFQNSTLSLCLQHHEFASHFGKTIRAVFTDEPSFLAKKAEREAVAGTAGIIDLISSWLGYDFTPHLPALWYADEAEAERRRRDYSRTLQPRLEETFYRPISRWCQDHGVALTGHPAEPDAIGPQKSEQFEVILGPDKDAADWWAGAPSVVRDKRGTFWLACRMRTAEGQRGRRGYEIRILRSEDGRVFRRVHAIRREEVPIPGFERPSLLLDPADLLSQIMLCGENHG